MLYDSIVEDSKFTTLKDPSQVDLIRDSRDTEKQKYIEIVVYNCTNGTSDVICASKEAQNKFFMQNKIYVY
jgi:hypothetical protein